MSFDRNCDFSCQYGGAVRFSYDPQTNLTVEAPSQGVGVTATFEGCSFASGSAYYGASICVDGRKSWPVAFALSIVRSSFQLIQSVSTCSGSKLQACVAVCCAG